MSEAPKKTVLILGARGLIGSLLRDNLADDYHVIPSDIADRGPSPEGFLTIDVRDYDGMLAAIPPGVDVLINLTAFLPHPAMVDPRNFSAMSDVYVRGSYNVFAVARSRGIPRVIFASSIQVSGGYRAKGLTFLGRPISSNDPPWPQSVYGAMKSCGESFGRLFAEDRGLSVINLRLGVVSGDEVNLVQRRPRARGIILSQKDAIGLFRAALETDLHYGVFFGVSDNPERPWEIRDAVEELGFLPRENSEDLLKRARGWRRWVPGWMRLDKESGQKQNPEDGKKRPSE